MRKPPPFSIRNILLLTIGTLALLVVLLVGREASGQRQRLRDVQALKEATLIGDGLFDAGESLSAERHIAFSMLHAPDLETVNVLRPRLEESRRKTDAAMAETLRMLEKYKGGKPRLGIGATEKQFEDLQALRKEVDRFSPLPVKRNNGRDISDRWFRDSTDMILRTQSLWTAFIRNFIQSDPIVSVQMRFKYSIWVAAEYSGRQRSLIGRLIVENVPVTPEEQAQLLRWQGIVDLSWESAEIFALQSRLETLMPYMKDAKSDYDNINEMVHDLFYVPGARQRTPYPISAELWLELATQANDSLYALKDAALKETRLYMEGLERGAERMIFIHGLVLLFTLLLCGYSFQVVILRVLRPINTMVEALVDVSEGKPVSPALLQIPQRDEIGKLAHVLSVSQKNVEEIKHYSVMLEKYVADLKSSNQELDDFAYIASHDLKEPLRGLISQASFLMEDYQDKLDEDGIRRIRRVIYLSQRLEQLIGDLLYFSRLGRTELAVQEVDPNAIVGEIRQMMDTFLRERNARIIIPEPMPRIVCDKIKIGEVFRNLIANAAKYNDKPERIIEVGHLPVVQAPHGEEQGVFYVKDNGVGIEPEFKDQIFRIFKRLQNPAVKHEEGTGSGLTFVKKIVERHKGRIWFESEPGKGSTFYFTLGSKE